MDVLKQSALAFQNLLKYEYEITAGSKKTLLEMVLYFSKEHFMHLIGLHKLTDLQIKRYSRERMYDMIIRDELTYDYIKKSAFFSEIEERIVLFPLRILLSIIIKILFCIILWIRKDILAGILENLFLEEETTSFFGISRHLKF